MYHVTINYDFVNSFCFDKNIMMNISLFYTVHFLLATYRSWSSKVPGNHRLGVL